jgi:hypothetical protein
MELVVIQQSWALGTVHAVAQCSALLCISLKSAHMVLPAWWHFEITSLTKFCMTLHDESTALVPQAAFSVLDMLGI